MQGGQARTVNEKSHCKFLDRRYSNSTTRSADKVRQPNLARVLLSELGREELGAVPRHGHAPRVDGRDGLDREAVGLRAHAGDLLGEARFCFCEKTRGG